MAIASHGHWGTKMISFHPSFAICFSPHDLGTSRQYNVTAGLDMAAALRSGHSLFPGYSAPGRSFQQEKFASNKQ